MQSEYQYQGDGKMKLRRVMLFWVVSILFFTFGACVKAYPPKVEGGFDKGDPDHFIVDSNVEIIPKGSFEGCANIREITIPNGVKRIERGAIEKCGVKYLNIGAEVIEPFIIDNGGDALKEVRILKGVKVFPSDLTGDAVPKTIFLNTLKGRRSYKIFSERKLINEINPVFFVSPLNSYYSSDDDGVLYDKKKEKIISVPSRCYGKFVIPNTVKYICSGCFSKTLLSEIVIPQYDCKIGKDIMQFKNCTDFEDINLKRFALSEVLMNKININSLCLYDEKVPEIKLWDIRKYIDNNLSANESSMVYYDEGILSETFFWKGTLAVELFKERGGLNQKSVGLLNIELNKGPLVINIGRCKKIQYKDILESQKAILAAKLDLYKDSTDWYNKKDNKKVSFTEINLVINDITNLNKIDWQLKDGRINHVSVFANQFKERCNSRLKRLSSIVRMLGNPDEISFIINTGAKEDKSVLYGIPTIGQIKSQLLCSKISLVKTFEKGNESLIPVIIEIDTDKILPSELNMTMGEYADTKLQTKNWI